MILWERTGNTGREQECKCSRQQLGRHMGNALGNTCVIMQMTQNLQCKRLR